ncbi:hypothetical protein [Kocuria rosea]|uniref:hypothetical protein n=1 Tax=Kocuria rosea TaxID=1275 RepID=UPI000F6FFBFB|nr:hypothetical protein [Kocuria rosea]MEB2527411.1 hypothetical protein [Kocuria rosea]MEB2617558.1 hypothetical protein [Kocuria rosea]VEH41289.1 Uncharacterised protein [Kocuria rosea]
MTASAHQELPAFYYGRTQDQWEQMLAVVEDFLIEMAEIEDQTNYSEVNARLLQEGLPGFKFFLDSERAAIGSLLGQISERSYVADGILLTVLVIHHDTPNDIGGGFWRLAAKYGMVPPKPNDHQKLDALVDLTTAVYARHSIMKRRH